MAKDTGRFGNLDLEISLVGHRSISAPKIQISLNEKIYFDQQVDGAVIWTQQCIGQPQNRLVIRHHGKTHLDMRRDRDDRLIDMWCDVDYVKINRVMLDINSFSAHGHFFHDDDGGKIISSYLGRNGSLIIDFALPMWKFWAQCQHYRAVD